jgi:hypothetical protein
VATPDNLPVRVADALLHVDADTGMIDVSYAAAWQLGRLLALRSSRFTAAFGDWRRTQRRVHHLGRPSRATPIPLVRAGDPADPAPPQVVDDWLAGLNRLTDVPFNYLVPDERMLPPESLRFFHLDRFWIRCLLDGALSLGRVTEGDYSYDREHLAHVSAQRYPNASGFLMRSALVSGWPGMLIDAYDTTVPSDGDVTGLKPLTALRMEHLSDNVMLCLFDGDASTVHMHLQPETLHLGVDADSTSPTGYIKRLRDNDNRLKRGRTVPVRWRTTTSNRMVEQVINVEALAADIGSPLTAALFAKEMIEGVSSVLLRLDP